MTEVHQVTQSDDRPKVDPSFDDVYAQLVAQAQCERNEGQRLYRKVVPQG